MKFEVQKASSSSYKTVVELNSMNDLRQFVISLEKQWDRYIPVIIDFNIGSNVWGHTYHYDNPLEEELSGVIVIYDDYV